MIFANKPLFTYVYYLLIYFIWFRQVI